MAVLTGSLAPLILDQPADGSDPLTHNAVWQIGREIVFGAYLFGWHRPLMTNRSLWDAMRQRWLSEGLPTVAILLDCC